MAFSMRTRMGLWRSVLIYNLKPFNQLRLRRFYAPFIRPGVLCFDLGAHVGNRTQAWLDLGARVVSVEPQPACARYLERRFGGRDGWTLVEKAVGARTGTATMLVSSGNPAVSTLSKAWQNDIQALSSRPEAWDTRIKVNLVTLDALIATYGMPAFCKIDVEDYEIDVLQGLTQPIPALSFEFYPTTLLKASICIKLLEILSEYTYNWSMTESLRLGSPRWMSAGEMQDWLGAYTGRKSGDVYARRVSS